MMRSMAVASSPSSSLRRRTLLRSRENAGANIALSSTLTPPLRGAARARRLRSRSPRTPSWRPSPQSRGDLRGNIRVVCVQRSNLAGRPVFPVPIRFWRHRLRAGAAQPYPVRQGARSASLIAQSRGFAVGARRKHRESRHVEGVVGRHEDSHLCTSAPKDAKKCWFWRVMYKF